ncbi:hypothetical protein [Aquimarina rhabdastrellae]
MKNQNSIQHLTFVCLAILIALIDRNPLSLDQRIGTNYIENGFYLMYDGILNQSIGEPYSYRILTPYLIKILSSYTNISPINIAFLLNIIFLYFVLFLFTKYSKQYLSPFLSFLTSIILSFYITIIQSQVLGIIIIETQDILNALFIIILLILAKKEKWFLFGSILSLSIVNREVPIILILPYSYILIKDKKYIPFLFINISSFLVYFSIRFLINIEQNNYPDFHNLKTNFPGLNLKYFTTALKFNLHLLVLLFPILYLSFKNLKSKISQVKVLILTSIPFMIIHYVMGSIIELRLFLPLIIILLPIAIFNLKQNFEVEAKNPHF